MTRAWAAISAFVSISAGAGMLRFWEVDFRVKGFCALMCFFVGFVSLVRALEREE